MNSAKAIMILALFLTMRATDGQQPPTGCFCASAGGAHGDCDTRGCSIGYNDFCNNGLFDIAPLYYYVIYYPSHYPLRYPGYTGCNCPNSHYTGANGGYLEDASIDGYTTKFYNYATCTDYGGNARDSSDNVPDGVYDAIDCCNFCCNRHDPHVPVITTTSAPFVPSRGGEIIFYKSLYLSAFIMLVLAIVKIN